MKKILDLGHENLVKIGWTWKWNLYSRVLAQGLLNIKKSLVSLTLEIATYVMKSPKNHGYRQVYQVLGKKEKK